jgi:hypothetical protein
MKITIKYDDDFKEEPQELTLSNDELENWNSVGLHIGKISATIDLEDLYVAVQSFRAMRDLDDNRERVAEITEAIIEACEKMGEKEDK